MKVFSKVIMGLIPLALTGGANASLIGVAGAGAIIPAPVSVLDDDANCNDWVGQTCRMLGFDEKQNVTLGANVGVDGGGFIAAGQKVSSHMIFLNTPRLERNESNATWLFDGIILGVMSDTNGLLEAASNAALGAPGTTYYAGGFGNRGFENAQDWYFGVGTNSLEVNMLVTEPGDWIRVVTAAKVPEPGTLMLLGTGLIGLFGLRKQKA